MKGTAFIVTIRLIGRSTSGDEEVAEVHGEVHAAAMKLWCKILHPTHEVGRDERRLAQATDALLLGAELAGSAGGFLQSA